MFVVGAQEREVLTLSIKQHVFNFHGRTVKTHGRRGPEEERTGVRHGLSQVGSYSEWILTLPS